MILFSGVRISMALIKTNPELHGLKIAERGFPGGAVVESS